MIHKFVIGICPVIVGVSGLLAFSSFVVMLVGVFRSAALRCTGVSYFTAVTSRNILFRPELYMDAAAGPRKLHRLGLAGTILFPILAISAGCFHQWIVRS